MTLMVLTALNAPAAEPEPSFAAGQKYYMNAEFRKSAAQFEAVCQIGHDPEACYRAGISYERLADIATPFGCRLNAKARGYLREAATMAPAQPFYRQALFDHLLDSSDCSRGALLEAVKILSAMPESDPDYPDMLRHLQTEKRLNASGDARVGRMFLLLPRAIHRAATVRPAPKIASTRDRD